MAYHIPHPLPAAPGGTSPPSGEESLLPARRGGGVRSTPEGPWLTTYPIPSRLRREVLPHQVGKSHSSPLVGEVACEARRRGRRAYHVPIPSRLRREVLPHHVGKSHSSPLVGEVACEARRRGRRAYHVPIP